MPISDEYKTIFIHIPRTGGTSFEDTLKLRENKKKTLIGIIPGKNIVYQHLTPKQLREYIPVNKWESYYKFVIVRNPLDRAVSDFSFFKKNKKGPLLGIHTFLDYCKLAEKVVTQESYNKHILYDHFRPQYKYLQGIKYNKICRMESYGKDIEQVKKIIGCNIPELHKNGGSAYKIIPTLEEKKIIQRVYHKDYKILGYNY